MGKTAHHIGANSGFFEGINTVFLSGSPSRAIGLYSLCDKQEELIQNKRGLPLGRGIINRQLSDGQSHQISIVSATTGMGFGSNEIVVNEALEMLAEHTNRNYPSNLVRLGTCGTHSPNFFFAGDIIIAQDVYAPFGAVDDLIETRHEDHSYHFKFAYLKFLERVLEQKINGAEPTPRQASQIGDMYDYLNCNSQKEFQAVANDLAWSSTRNNPASLENYLDSVRMRLAKMEMHKVYSCDQKLVEYCQEAAQSVKIIGQEYAVNAGSIFSKQYLSSEMVGAFGMIPDARRRIALEYRAKALHQMEIAGSEMEEAVHTSLAHLAQAQGYNVRAGGLMTVVNNPRSGGGAGLFADSETIAKAENNLLSFALEVAVVAYKHDVLGL